MTLTQSVIDYYYEYDYA